MRVFIIAEAGVNHNGSIETAYKLIDIAADAGVDAVKFQTFKAENLVVKNTQKAAYQKQTTNPKESQFDMIKKLELDSKMHSDLATYSSRRGIMFLSSPFDIEGIKLLEKLDLTIYKIPSGEITNLPYLRYIGALNKKVILSTGMSQISEIRAALEVLIDNGTSIKNITVLHANTMYPTPMKDVNLSAMITIQKEFNVAIGYSDHTLGIEVGIAAVAMGASVIEKHFTIDRTMKGPDHKASLEPLELKSMVDAIRNIEKAFGNGKKVPSLGEKVNTMLARKSIVASQPIRKGEKFSNANLAVKRPGSGISPMKWDEVSGMAAKKDYEIDELISI